MQKMARNKFVNVAYTCFFTYSLITGIDRFFWANQSHVYWGLTQVERFPQVPYCSNNQKADKIEFFIKQDRSLVGRCGWPSGDGNGVWPFYRQFRLPTLPARVNELIAIEN
jgi:hypothetical protein